MSEIADAIHADAEAARTEIRAAGISCPSCGVNMADLPAGHMLVLTSAGIRREDGTEGPWAAQCAGGQIVNLPDSVPMSDSGFEIWRAAVNVSLYDDFRKREDEAWSQVLGFDVRGEWPPFGGAQ